MLKLANAWRGLAVPVQVCSPQNESVSETKYHGLLIRAILDEDGKFRFED
ncbi:MAG: hypothetical protein KGQ60_00520 [Planctomycetes bacterium]|nr:hypothetical protein [Planctomycetota bacterium]